MLLEVGPPDDTSENDFAATFILEQLMRARNRADASPGMRKSLDLSPGAALDPDYKKSPALRLASLRKLQRQIAAAGEDAKLGRVILRHRQLAHKPARGKQSARWPPARMKRTISIASGTSANSCATRSMRASSVPPGQTASMQAPRILWIISREKPRRLNPTTLSPAISALSPMHEP